MVNAIRAFIKHIIRSRLFAFSVVLVVMMGVLTNRLFVLQIIRGEDYLNNYTLLVEKERDIAATRGNIYDCNGEVLAYNELAYSVVIEDNGTYESSKQRSKELNEIIRKTILIIEEHGDSVENNFDIVYEDGKFAFKNSGTTRLRFLADVFGRKTIDELKFNSKLGIDEANATAKQVVKYLVNDTYEIEDVDDERLAFEIAVVRYGLSANFYRRFISTSIATGVSIETVAAINENLAELQGVSIVESTLRRYVDSEYFCHIIGYTGKISQNEFDDLGGEEAGYSLNDYVGKAG
ncbi:MAG: peptidoglycan glycosyltransferase, partial [Lachnospiraceae bacterium]|nr:peptidoglycan glycosyltransferase [Lachnospiraceae bacterium]